MIYCLPHFYDIQLIIEREAGRVFKGWNEGKIFFAPTYKYSHNSDSYAGETLKSKKKRRTPAWYVILPGGLLSRLAFFYRTILQLL